MSKSINILDEIKSRIISQNASAKVYLYGSRAKGMQRVDSDWDILILLNIDKITPEIEYTITSLLYDLEFDTGQVISPIIYAENEWNQKYSVTPFYQNVMQEGILL